MYLNGVQIRNLVEGKSYKFRLRCCFSAKEVPAMSAMSALPLRDDAVEPELLHWSAFGPPSDDFKVPQQLLGCPVDFPVTSSLFCALFCVTLNSFALQVPADAAADSWNPLAAVWNSLPNSH